MDTNKVETNIKYCWLKTDEKAGADLLKVEICGHKGEVYRARSDMRWVARVDLVSKRGFESEELAKQYAENKIATLLHARFKKAISDLALFSELGFDFTSS